MSAGGGGGGVGRIVACMAAPQVRTLTGAWIHWVGASASGGVAAVVPTSMSGLSLLLVAVTGAEYLVSLHHGEEGCTVRYGHDVLEFLHVAAR